MFAEDEVLLRYYKKGIGEECLFGKKMLIRKFVFFLLCIYTMCTLVCLNITCIWMSDFFFIRKSNLKSHRLFFAYFLFTYCWICGKIKFHYIHTGLSQKIKYNLFGKKTHTQSCQLLSPIDGLLNFDLIPQDCNKQTQM